MRKRVFSGIQPSGQLHLGNYLGAVRTWEKMQHNRDAFFCIVDLHAVTVPQPPGELKRASLRLSQILIAAGLDPVLCTVFVQSHVREHTECAWLMQCVASFGELSRMTQFKDKSEQHDFVSAALFTYPTLQAADILLYDTDEVPVGADQRQHLELTRDIAHRFNSRFGVTFKMPEAVINAAGARVMDLQHPYNKMSKSSESLNGTIDLLDKADVVTKKIKRAVTDNESEVRYDPDSKPGVSNLLSILAAASDQQPVDVAENYTTYGSLKTDTAEAVVEMLKPIQSRFVELEADPSETMRLLNVGAEKARAVASTTLARAKQRMGFLTLGSR